MKFVLDFNKELVIFEDGTTCNIENDGFNYRGVEFTLESDVEKDLSNEFNETFYNVSDEDAYVVWTYNGGYQVSCEGIFDTFDEAQDAYYEAEAAYLSDLEIDSDEYNEQQEVFAFNSRIEEVL